LEQKWSGLLISHKLRNPQIWN